MSRNVEFGKGSAGPKPEDFWNETYISGASESTESALHSAYEHLSSNPPRYFNNCDETCQKVHEHLKSQGVKSRIVSGDFTAGYRSKDPIPMSREHVWLEVDGHVVDPTAGQFRGQFKGPFKQSHYRASGDDR